MKDPSRFSFGATSAILTSLALIVGLDETSNARMSIISALLIVGIADNIYDSLGIHIYKESQASSNGSVMMHTFSNYFSRLAMTIAFILVVIIFPMPYALFLSLIFGLAALSFMSYAISVNRKTNPYKEIAIHVGIALIVMTASHFLGRIIAVILS